MKKRLPNGSDESMTIHRHKDFDKQMDKIEKPLRQKVYERVQLLVMNESHPLLHNHKLGPPYDGYRSINITGNFRLVYKRIEPDIFYLRAV